MKKKVIILLHISFWSVFLLSIFSKTFQYKLMDDYLSHEEKKKLFLYIKVYFNPLYFYIGYFGIIEIIKKKRNIVILILSTIITYIFLYFISKKAFTYGFAPLPDIVIWASIGCLFRFSIDWYKKKSEILILEKENMSSKLALLKSQINPHFLFNTLHNIDTLIYDNREKASNSLEKLSDIMRYMLKDTNTDFVTLQKEIELLENYLSLEMLRFKNDMFLNYNIIGDYKNYKIAPMILIPFIENALTHSVDSNIEDGVIIKIRIDIDKNRLLLICENKFDDSDKDNTGHGIGLKTVKKRLDLIYKNRYKLSINAVNLVFKVFLELELNEN